MSNWNDLAVRANAALFRVGGETIYYSRPESTDEDAVPEFETLGIPDTSPSAASPTAQQRVMQVQISAIPLGPKKGDGIRYAGRTYLLQELLAVVPEDDLATLGIRWTGL